MRGYELVNFCEFDLPAVKSYCAIHEVSMHKNLGDITLVDENKLKPFNMICGGSPCQDFSIAGEQKGSIWTCKDCKEQYNPLMVHWSRRNKCPHCSSENIEKTRSSLLVEYLRVIRANKPNFGMYENVKNIVGKKFKDTTFKLFLDELHEYGYNTYWKVLNAKDFGIPQNRERVYLIFIKRELDNGKFVFPEGFDSGICLKDLLQEDVDEKYYISNKMREYLFNAKFHQDADSIQRGDICKCLRVGGTTPYVETVITDKETGDPQNIIRKIIPLECFRLMGFSDTDFLAAMIGNRQEAICLLEKYTNYRKEKKLLTIAESTQKVSDTQLYKQAGNSIVVNVIYYILVELYRAMPYLFDDLRLSSFFSGIGAFEIALNRLYESIDTGKSY